MPGYRVKVWKFYDRLVSQVSLNIHSFKETLLNSFFGEMEKGEDWNYGEKAPQQRWPEFVQEDHKDDDSETSIGWLDDTWERSDEE